MYLIAPIVGAIISISISMCLFGHVNPHDSGEEDEDLEKNDLDGRRRRQLERERVRSSIAHNNLRSPKRFSTQNRPETIGQRGW
jgi:uncharacterized membrane protein